VVDDGTDSVQDFFEPLKKEVHNLTYVRLDAKLPLGKKRNLMHKHATGDILVYMDDDDFYPPNRVAHAVATLVSNPSALCAGSSVLHIYFKHIDTIIEFGPYGKNHATAGTFAFRKELLNDTAYDDDASLAEEKAFLKNYTVPFVQLDPKKTILVFSHEHNTFDKRFLLDNPKQSIMKSTKLKVADFVADSALADFFVNQLHPLLVAYEPGAPSNKPDVMASLKTRADQATPQFEVRYGDKVLKGEEILTHMNQQRQLIDLLKAKIKEQTAEIALLKTQK
jgi:glycosyltransferase involved in cell wall biosynthesis